MTDEGQEPDYRFTLANERTFLAWIRTALGLIAGGVAVVHLVPPTFLFPGARQGLGVLLTLLGGFLALLAIRRWKRVQEAMRHDADLPPTRLPVLLGVGMVAATLLVLLLILSPEQA